MDKALKVLLIVALTGVALFMARTGMVQEMFGMALTANGPLPPAYIPRLFPFPMEPQLQPPSQPQSQPQQ